MSPSSRPHPVQETTPDFRALPLWAAACFFVSGSAGLLYEVAWSKQLAYLLGNSLHAVATVVAAFLGGLALGARALGVPLAGRGRGARVYAALEVGVAVLGILSLPVLRGLDPLVGTLYRSLGGEGVAFGIARFVLLFVLLVPPAALMGATLPVLVAQFDRELVGPALARLYAVNTFGAVAGSVAGGFVLLPGVGLTVTTWVAATLNVVAAAVAWMGSRRYAPDTPPAAETAVAAGSSVPRTSAVTRAPRAEARTTSPRAAEPARSAGFQARERLGIALLFGLSGFAALAFQIAWVRLFGLVFGSSVYSFSAVLGVYLTGLALGSAAIARAMRRGVSLAGFARIQLGLAAMAAIAVHAFNRLPEWMFALTQRAGTSWPALFAGEVGLAAAVVLLPCVLLGAAFPVAARLLQAKDGGHAAGFAYAVNTAGTILGSLAAGFLLVPTLGVTGTHLAALGLSLAIGLGALALAHAKRRTSRKDVVLAGAVTTGVAVLAFTAPRWDPSLMSAGLYRPGEARHVAERARERGGEGPVVWGGTRMERVLFYREGLNGSVLVGTNDATGNRWLRVGGKVEASTADMETQVLIGMLPAACADSGARTLVIGHGSGVTAAAVLASGAGVTDVVELEPAVIEASRFFHTPGEDPLEDSRVRLTIGDARTWLAHRRERYGLIVSQPSNPWIAGVNNLFTVDFYRLAKSRLEPDGVFCQWQQLYELTPQTFASLLASFLEVFPEGHAFAVWGATDVVLLSAPPRARLALERLRTPAARRMLQRAGLAAPEYIAGNYSGPFEALRPIARGAPLNRDDRPIVEYRAPRDLIETGATSPAATAASVLPLAASPPSGPLFSAWSPEEWYTARARYFLSRGDADRAARAVSYAEAAGQAEVARRRAGGVAAAARRGRVLAALEAARLAGEARRTDESIAILERAARSDSADALAWVLLANQLRLGGKLDEAESALTRVGASGDSTARTEGAMVSGLIEMARSRPAPAAARFREAQRWNPLLPKPYALEAQALRGAGDIAGARASVARGLGMAPADAELRQMREELEASR